MTRVILCLTIVLSAICASAQEYRNTLVPAFCSLGDTIYAPLDTVLFAFDQEVILPAEDTEEIKTYIIKDEIGIENGHIICRKNKHGKGYVFVKYGHKSSLTLPAGNYQIYMNKSTIGAKRDEYLLTDDIYLNFNVPEDLGYGKATFSGDTIVSTHYGSFKINFPTDIKATGTDNYMILSQEWKEPVKIPFEIYDNYLYSTLYEKMYFDDGVKYTLTLPAGSVSAKYRDDIVNLETNVEFIGGNKSDSKLVPTACSLTDPLCETISSITFSFAEDVTCTMAEFTHAYIYCDGEEVASANASYSFFSDENRDETKAVLDITPGPFVPEKGKSYRLHVLPEVFMTLDDNETKWNDDIYVDFVGGDINGVEAVTTANISMTVVNGRLTVSGISAGTEIAVFAVDGKAVANVISGGTTVEIDLPAKAVYLVTVNGKTYKVAN